MEIVEIIDDPATEIIEVHVAGPQGPPGSDAEVAPAIEAHAAREDVHGIPAVKETAEAAIPASEKGVTVATLSGGVLPTDQLPPLAITEPYVIDTEPAMLALDAQTGDVAIRTDISKTFILAAEPATELSNWTEILTPVPPVTSVAGKTGNVELATGDVSGLDAALASKQEKDGPWKPLTLAADCVDVSTLFPDFAPPLRYRRNGDVLRFSGTIGVTNNAAPGKLLATLDEDDWPQYPVGVGIAAGGTDDGAYITTALTVATNGEISTLEPVTAVPMSHITIELT